MARKPRIHYPGAYYHVILRGNAGDPIFFDDRDRYRLYIILQYAVELFHCRIHAFCLMRNHIHIVIEVGDVPLSRIMQNVSLRFTKWINFTQSRTGHLFQGRYKALLIDAEEYLLELVRYVHLNPVRAGAAEDVDEYLWSSHHCYLGKTLIPWLETGFVLSLFSPILGQARVSYGRFVQDGMGEGRREEFHCGTCEGRILGNESFVDDALTPERPVKQKLWTLDDIVVLVCDHFQITPERLRAPGKVRPMIDARAVTAALVQVSHHLKLTDLGTLLNRDLSALGKVAKRVANDDKLHDIYAVLVDQLKSSQAQISKTLA